MQEKMQQILDDARRAIEKAASTAELEALRVQLQGKKGSLTQLLRGMGQLSPEERPRMGALINSAREDIARMLETRGAALKKEERARRLREEAVDVTEPRAFAHQGTLHPISLVQAELVDIFTGMGFEVVEGPEVELDTYNFELLNLPKNHPARDAQDSFYIEDNIVLRTHTSPVQARTMLTRKPPIRIVCPGRVYRADELDATHSPVFHQMEGLVVDRDVTMGDLKGTLDAFAQGLFGEGITTRFHPSYFPFTEPSAEMDISCNICGGKGCPFCKHTGWVEILGCGMVDPNVLELNGIDSKVYSGYALGMGIERITNLKYQVKDLRMFSENDTRFLKEFLSLIHI